MRKRQQKKNQRKAYPVVKTTVGQLNAFSGRLWAGNLRAAGPAFIHYTAEDGPPRWIGVDPAAGLGEAVFMYYDTEVPGLMARQLTPSSPPEAGRAIRALQRGDVAGLQVDLNRANNIIMESMRNGSGIMVEGWDEVNARRAQELADQRRTPRGLRMQELVHRAQELMGTDVDPAFEFTNSGSIRRRVGQRGPATFSYTIPSLDPHSALSLDSLADAIAGIQPLPQSPPERQHPLRRLPDPEQHPLIDRRELAGQERNWKEEEPEPQGRWMPVPVVKRGQMLFSYKKVRRRVENEKIFRDYLRNAPPAQMSAAEHRQWMVDHETEIDQYRAVATWGNFSWDCFWQEKAGGWDYDAWEEQERRRLLERERSWAGKPASGVEIERQTFYSMRATPQEEALHRLRQLPIPDEPAPGYHRTTFRLNPPVIHLPTPDEGDEEI